MSVRVWCSRKKKRSNLLTEGHSNVSERVGFDWRFGIRGTVLIGL